MKINKFIKKNFICKYFFSTHQRLNVENPAQQLRFFKSVGGSPKKTPISQEGNPISKLSDNFCHWLVGITDGDGCFSFSVNKSSKYSPIWNCTFKIGQSKYNLRLLYYIKKNLEIGKINLKSGKSMAEYRIRDRKILLNYIVPIFDKYPLYSTKQFYYLRWKKALEILENESLTIIEKNEKLNLLKQQIPECNYISAAWKIDKPSDSWIYGFTEAEGSFFITLKGKTSKGINRIVHSFGITQKLDIIILQFLRSKFHISAKVITNEKLIHKLETTNFRSLQTIKLFFLNKLKGMKSVEYRIWSRSFKYKNNFENLLKVQLQIRKLKQKLL
jgi:hypothetical protein